MDGGDAVVLADSRTAAWWVRTPITTLETPEIAKQARTLPVDTVMMASTWPANVLVRLGPWSIAVLIVPLPQSAPAINAPSSMNGSVCDSAVTVWITNWLGSIAGNSWAGVPNCAYSAGVSSA